ncbi:glucose dehydrogenase [FAD, quinone]-like [Euwallacea similis]|uniref:glucose dehydrogenase [FAD, quinone]-like n=1 Tax=Euwallacea similis TaxID=1736056 RepID=UPI00344FDBC8
MAIIRALCFLVQLFFVSGDYNIFTDLYQQAEALIAGAYQPVPVNNNAYFEGQRSKKIHEAGVYDFIIVGGGAAGSVLANRLTENHFTVLVIEAGGEDPDVSAVLGLGPYMILSKWNWGYNTTTQSNACLASIDQQCLYARGKSLGGSTNIMGGYYVRGNAKDYDKWADEGNEDWSYNDILPYFRKAELANFSVDVEPQYHGFHGPQVIGITEDVPGLSSSLLNAFGELGLEELDYNGENQIGYSRPQQYLSFNIRSSTNYSYIRPVRHRRNLFITLNALATRLIIKNKRAHGVEFVKGGQTYRAFASKEVIVSCGSINTPQLLMLSGIGPSDELMALKIDVIADLPVGKNMQDHVLFDILVFKTNNTYYNLTLEEQLKLWYQAKRPLTPAFGGLLVSFFDYDNDTVPEVEIFALPASSSIGEIFNRASDVYAAGFENFNALSDFIIGIALCHPVSVGEVTLASSDPRDYPLINPNYLSNETDIEIIYQGIQTVLQLRNTTAFQELGAELHLMLIPGCDDDYKRESKDWWFCAIRHFASTVFHPTGTTRMGTTSENSVVNSELKVHGLHGLRVVDAGVMPSPISGHTAAPTVMIAEKAADLIKQDHLWH